MSNNRSADASMNGFFYQRYYTILQFLQDTEYEYILEEGFEDIDLIKHNSNRDIIQIKYFKNSNDNESLTYDSGLYKVIVSKTNIENINNIDKIYYKVFSACQTTFNPHLRNIFERNLFAILGKYILLLGFKANTDTQKYPYLKNVKIDNIKQTEQIFEEYKTHILDFYNTYKSKTGNTIIYIYDFLIINDNCKRYFSKFKLEPALPFKDLNLLINNIITTKYNSFISNTGDETYKYIKIETIKGIILNTLTNKMFEYKDVNLRKIKYDEINNIINLYIDAQTNTDNLYDELLKQNSKFIDNIVKQSKLPGINANIALKQCHFVNLPATKLYNFLFHMQFLKKYNNILDFKHENIKNIVQNQIFFLHSHLPNSIGPDNIKYYTQIITYINILCHTRKKNAKFPYTLKIIRALSALNNTTIKNTKYFK